MYPFTAKQMYPPALSKSKRFGVIVLSAILILFLLNLSLTERIDAAPALTPDQDPSPIGFLDAATCDVMEGWTGTAGAFDRAIDVHFYAGPAGGGGELIGTTTANGERETAVCSALGGPNCEVCRSDDPQCLHGFKWIPSATVLNGAPLDIYAYGVDNVTGLNSRLQQTPQRIVCEPRVDLNFEPGWRSENDKNSTRPAIGDVDNDGDLDLVVGATRLSTQTLQVYLNQGDGYLVENWVEPDAFRTAVVSLADIDNDGDLDLAVGVMNPDSPGNAQNRIYRNEGLDDDGNMRYELFWTSTDSDQTTSFAWADYDGDGDLDLAVGNSGVDDPPLSPVDIPEGAFNRIYRNNHMEGITDPPFQDIWQSGNRKFTTDIAWADMNGDNTLDLIEINADAALDGGCFDIIFNRDNCDIDIGDRNYIYYSENGVLDREADWESGESEASTSVAIGDIDNDGDNDMIVGNASLSPFRNFSIFDLDKARPAGQPNRIYINNNGELETTASWSTIEQDATSGVRLGDYDNDGDLDLLVGNVTAYENEGSSAIEGSPKNRIYQNDNGSFSRLATWSLPEGEDTVGIAFGDMDNDGDLDIISTNGNLVTGQPDRIYFNNNFYLSERPTWSSPQSELSWQVVWADLNGDGFQDAVVANGGEESTAVNQIYLNDAGTLTLDNDIWSPTADPSTAVAVGDVDGDSDFDLVIGNFEAPNKLYIYDDTTGEFNLDTSWQVDTGRTSAIAWADMNGDGPLDLVVASQDGPTRVFLNSDTGLATTPVWEAPENDSAWSMGLADVDNDGDLDIAVTSKLRTVPTRLYLNKTNPLTGEVTFELGWTPAASEIDASWVLAWGDVNNDGFADLAVGNDGAPIYIYMNQAGTLESNHSWRSDRSKRTKALSWGDYDGDGDLDLFEGNDEQGNDLYINQNGALSADNRAQWSTQELENTRSVAWGDLDNDGDLDMLIGNIDSPMRLHRNPRRVNGEDVSTQTFAIVNRPGNGAEAQFISSPEILSESEITIDYTLFDAESRAASRIIAEYSIDGGQAWKLATPASGTQITDLQTAPWPEGVAHTFEWNAFADLVKNDQVAFRISVQPEITPSPILWGSQGSRSSLFRVEAPRFVRVVDANGQAIPGARLFANGMGVTETANAMTSTDLAGRINPSALQAGTPLIVLAEQEKTITTRRCTAGDPDRAQIRYHISNLSYDENEAPQFDALNRDGELLLALNRANTLILFDLIVSIEWEASQAYLEQIEQAFKSSSDALYDATDGQMAFGEVSIYHNKACWNGADIRIAAANDVVPHAATGEIGNDDPNVGIRLGRGWDRKQGDGSWAAPDGFRTIVHEFAHYAFGVEDEYFGPRYLNDDKSSGVVVGEKKTHCIGIFIRDAVSEEEINANASVMYWQYTATEFSMRGVDDMWDASNCEETQQFDKHGESVWETIERQFTDSEGSVPRWEIITPLERGGEMMIGPDQPPTVLPDLPFVSIPQPGLEVEQIQTVKLTDPDGEPMSRASVTLIKANGVSIKQGVPNSQGEIEIVGAEPGDTIKALAIDGSLQNEAEIINFDLITLPLKPIGQ